MIVEKYREYYKYRNVFVTIDNVKDLECFIELELINKSNEEELFKVAKELEIVGKIIIES